MITSNDKKLLGAIARARSAKGRLAFPGIRACVQNLVGKEVNAVDEESQYDPQLLKKAKLEEKAFIEKMGVYEVVPRSEAAKRRCNVIKTRWVIANKGTEEKPQLRARWVAQEFRTQGGDRNAYFAETPDLALVKSVLAHAAEIRAQCDAVVAVFDVRRAYFYADEDRDTYVELPDFMSSGTRATHV